MDSALTQTLSSALLGGFNKKEFTEAFNNLQIVEPMTYAKDSDEDEEPECDSDDSSSECEQEGGGGWLPGPIVYPILLAG